MAKGDLLKNALTERQRFEKWFRGEMQDPEMPMRRDGNGDYKNTLARWAWLGWKARHKTG